MIFKLSVLVSVPLNVRLMRCLCADTQLGCCIKVAPEAKALYLQNKQYLETPCQAQVANQPTSGFCRYNFTCAAAGLTIAGKFNCLGPDHIQCCVGGNSVHSTVQALPTATQTDLSQFNTVVQPTIGVTLPFISYFCVPIVLYFLNE